MMSRSRSQGTEVTIVTGAFSASAFSLNEDINTLTTSPELLGESLHEHLTVLFE